MSADGIFLYHLANELNENLITGKIQKISQLAKADFLFLVRKDNQIRKLYFSLSTSMARVHLTEENYNSVDNPGGFCMFLRKYIEQGNIKHIKTLNFDRVVEIKVENVTEVGDITDYYIILELFGRYANMIILDDNRLIINAYKHIPPFENPDRIIVNGVVYPLPTDEKVDPFDYTRIAGVFMKESLTYQDLIDNIRGISPLLANYILEKANYNSKQAFRIYEETLNEPVLATADYSKKSQFYFIDIFTQNSKHYESISKLLDEFYRESSNLDRVKQIHRYLNQLVKTNLTKQTNKLEKLSRDLKKAKNNDVYRIKGDVLLTNQNQIKKGDANFIGISYETSKEVIIDLDRRLSPIQNANRYYTKYRKQKSAISHIDKQIKLTKILIDYFTQIANQLETTFDLDDLEEIQDELFEKGFVRKQKKSKKNQTPNYDEYVDAEGVTILVGKNNRQNNYLTHRYANKNYYWFHVQKQTGSHVIVCQSEGLAETTIRSAANLSAYFSKSRDSSSVPVDYTQVKNIKKVPGEMGSYVTYTNQKTIYIDPDYEAIKLLTKKRK